MSSSFFIFFENKLIYIQDSTEEKIHTLCGIFDTNCFELFPTGAGDIISGYSYPIFF